MAPAVRSSLDVAIWFHAVAKRFGHRLQPLKLQRLLYLAQSRYAFENGGAKLMPATFLAGEHGPVEPTIQHAFERGQPPVPGHPPGAEVERLLLGVWRRHGAKSLAELEAIVKADRGYAAAWAEGRESEIVLATRAAPSVSTVDTDDAAAPHAAVGYLTSQGARVRPWRPGRKQVAIADAGAARPAAGSPPTVLGATADGRAVTRWMPGMKREPAGHDARPIAPASTENSDQ